MATSGNDTNAGTQAAPVKTINQAISLVPSGGTIVMRAGTYRDWYNSGTSYKIATKGFTLQAYPHEQVWLDGSDVVPSTSWTSDGSGHWYLTWDTPSFCNGHYYDFPYNNQAKSPNNLTGASGTTYSDNQGPCTHWDNYGSSTANYPAAGDPQMLFIDGSRIAETDSLSTVSSNSFYYDWSAKRLYMGTNPSGHTVELAARPNALVLGGGPSAVYAIKGIGFRRYATNEYSNLTGSAVYMAGGPGGLIENDTFTQMAAQALSFSGPVNSTVNHSVFAYNGANGTGGNGLSASGQTDNYVIQNSVFNHYNLENYGLNCSLSCGAAGVKMAHMVGYTLKDNIFENGQGPATGAWCDTDCSGGIFVNNLVKNNLGGPGYHYEQNTGGIIASNLFINNKYGIDVGATDTKIYNNTLVNNTTINIRIYDDSRPLITSGISMANNVVYGNSVNDDYFGGGTSSTQSEPATWFTSLDYNSYWRPTSFVLYRMIDAADNHYNSSTSYTATYPSLEAHAQDLVGGSDPFFVDVTNGNYHLRTNSMAYHSGGPIPADVAAALGISTAAGQSRGAVTWPGQ